MTDLTDEATKKLGMSLDELIAAAPSSTPSTVAAESGVQKSPKVNVGRRRAHPYHVPEYRPAVSALTTGGPLIANSILGHACGERSNGVRTGTGFYSSRRWHDVVTTRNHAPSPGTSWIYVKNIPFSADVPTVCRHFAHAGSIVRVVMPTLANGRNYGEAHVKFYSALDAMKAVRELNRSKLSGRSVVVELSDAPIEKCGPFSPSFAVPFVPPPPTTTTHIPYVPPAPPADASVMSQPLLAPMREALVNVRCSSFPPGSFSMPSGNTMPSLLPLASAPVPVGMAQGATNVLGHTSKLYAPVSEGIRGPHDAGAGLLPLPVSGSRLGVRAGHPVESAVDGSHCFNSSVPPTVVGPRTFRQTSAVPSFIPGIAHRIQGQSPGRFLSAIEPHSHLLVAQCLPPTQGPLPQQDLQTPMPIFSYGCASANNRANQTGEWLLIGKHHSAPPRHMDGRSSYIGQSSSGSSSVYARPNAAAPQTAYAENTSQNSLNRHTSKRRRPDSSSPFVGDGQPDRGHAAPIDYQTAPHPPLPDGSFSKNPLRDSKGQWLDSRDLSSTCVLASPPDPQSHPLVDGAAGAFHSRGPTRGASRNAPLPHSKGPEGKSSWGNTVIVTNVPVILTAEDLQGAFSAIGRVVRTEVLLNRQGAHTGRVALEFDNHESAEDAVRRFDGGDLNGNTIRVFLE